MKRTIFLIVLLIVSIAWAATNGVVRPVDVVQTLSSGLKVVEITFATITDAETATFDVTGWLQRVVVDGTSNDADGDITISDMSGYNAVSLENKLGSGDISYILSAENAAGNVFGGIPMAGTHTLTLTNCAGAGATTIYLYYKVASY